MNKHLALTIVVACTLLVAACQDERARQLIDTKPIGDGLQFLGMMGVLTALVFVFGKFLTESEIIRWKYLPHLLVALLIVLSLMVAVAAVPGLIIPFSLAAVLAVALTFAWHHWK